MKKQQLKYYLFLVLSMLSVTRFFAQNNEAETKSSAAYFNIRGHVKENDTHNPIKDVSIQVNGGSYTNTGISGDFRLRVKKGDELIISHKDFETVYHTIKNNDRILIQVTPNQESKTKKYKRNNSFVSLIDSAKHYKKVSAERSIQFITKSIENSTSTKQNAEAFETLADIYMHWKQYDLAITNYKISLNNSSDNAVQLKLAKAYRKNNNFTESLSTYNNLEKIQLSNYQKVEYYEGLGDVNRALKKHNLAITTYQTALSIAKQHLITPKVTDLNSKIAQTYSETGEKKEAEAYFDNALDLASQQNKTRAIEEQLTVANFNNDTRNYKKEIELRKKAIPQIEDIETDSLIDNESDFTVQKQNYKIGNAYFLQNDYDNAITYLEESIKQADKREDLVVEKDGNRKLYEAYKNKGDYKKARVVFENYVKSLEKLYIKKEQQIAQLARFNKSIADKQNRIVSLESDRKLSESKYQLTNARNKNQKIIIYSLIGGVLLLLFAAYLMYKYIKQQKLANNLLALKSLRSQMNPHFIFNALNSVNSFIATNDERTANKYLSDFSKLMRSVLENSEQDFIPLQKEIELIELYTKLEHFRFKDKFDYTIKVDQTINITEYYIPPMLLQPYIENAVWHGLRYKKEKGILNIIIAKKSKNEITITITDNGIGRKKSKALKTKNQQKQNSKGMGNIKKRVSILNQMYKDKVDVYINDFQEENDTGTQVIVTLKRD